MRKQTVEHKTRAGYKIKLHTLQECHTRDALYAAGFRNIVKRE